MRLRFSQLKASKDGGNPTGSLILNKVYIKDDTGVPDDPGLGDPDTNRALFGGPGGRFRGISRFEGPQRGFLRSPRSSGVCKASKLLAGGTIPL